MYETLVRDTDQPVPQPPVGSGGVHVTGLGKRFGDLWALRNFSITVTPGTVLGLLGHNGAGKTTAIRILTTLSQPTEGRATVAGFDVVRDAATVRQHIGVASQQATVDGLMSARLNLQTIGRLYGMPRREARERGDALLEQLDLTSFADGLVRTYSGGMRRRLDLAASLMNRPAVLFLDEPTTGLDPLSRSSLWDMLRDLVSEGTTVILTTQYLEEADQLADDIVVLDHGETVAHGTPQDLKSRIGEQRLDVHISDITQLVAAQQTLLPYADSEPIIDEAECVITVPIKPGTRIVDVVRTLDDAGIDAIDVARREATLDDVFVALTHKTQTERPNNASPQEQS